MELGQRQNSIQNLSKLCTILHPKRLKVASCWTSCSSLSDNLVKNAVAATKPATTVTGAALVFYRFCRRHLSTHLSSCIPSLPSSKFSPFTLPLPSHDIRFTALMFQTNLCISQCVASIRSLLYSTAMTSSYPRTTTDRQDSKLDILAQ